MCELDLSAGTLIVKGVAGGGAMADYSTLPCNDDCDIATQDCQLPLCAGQPSVPPWYYNRNNITAVVIDSDVTHVGEFAFWNLSKLASVEIGRSVTNIGKGAFAGCGELMLVYSYNPDPPEFFPVIICGMPPCPEGSFSGVPHDAVLYVPSAGFTAYATLNSWSYHFSEIRPLMPTSVRNRAAVSRGNAAMPSVSVKGRTLNVRMPQSAKSSSAASARVSMIDMRGKTVAKFTARGDTTFSLAKIPAGQYFVEVRDGVGRRDRASVVVR